MGIRPADSAFIYAKLKYPVVRGFCRVCGEPRPPKAKWVTCCSKPCRAAVAAWPITWADVCMLVHERDHGICSACGCDCDKIERILNAAGREWYKHSTDWRFWYRCREALGWPARVNHWWEAHHLNDVATHGPAASIDELVTLCIPCHKEIHRPPVVFPLAVSKGRIQRPELPLFQEEP